MISLLKWFLIPITATAALNPVPSQPQKVPLLGENTPYVIDYPIDNGNTLASLVEPLGTSTIDDITLLKQYFPNNWQTMQKIAYCESRNRQNVSHKNTNGTTDYGYLEINSSHDAEAKELGLDYKGNLEDNIHMAKFIYDKSGYSAWMCSSGII